MKVVYNTKSILKEICKFQPYCFSKKKNKLILKRIVKKYKGRNVEFTFPICIEINPPVAGLIVGEGYIDERQFVFANSNEKIIKFILDFMSQFDITPKITLEVATKNINNNFIKEARENWERIIKNRIEKIRERKEFNNTTKMGTLHLRYSNSCFARILKIIIEDMKRKAESDKDITKEYIKGILAAEGNINIKKKTNCLYMVRVSAKRKNERIHYKKCLEKIGINIYCKDMPTIDKHDSKTLTWKTNKGRSGAVLINRWINFHKILSMDLLDIHEDKKQKFIKHFLYNKTTRWLLEFRDLPRKWFRAKDFEEIFKLSDSHCRVQKMLCLQFLEKRKINYSKKRPFYAYRLTDKYFEFINKLLNNAPFINS